MLLPNERERRERRGNLGHVDAAAAEVCGDQYAGPGLFEVLKPLDALLLRHVRMQI